MPNTFLTTGLTGGEGRAGVLRSLRPLWGEGGLDPEGPINLSAPLLPAAIIYASASKAVLLLDLSTFVY